MLIKISVHGGATGSDWREEEVQEKTERLGDQRELGLKEQAI